MSDTARRIEETFSASYPAWLFVAPHLRIQPGDVISGSIDGIDLADVTAETDLNAYNIGIRGLRPADQEHTWAAGEYVTINGLYFFWRGQAEDGRWHEGISTGLFGNAPTDKRFVRAADVFAADPAVTTPADIPSAGYVIAVHATQSIGQQVTIGAVVAHYVANNLASRPAGTWAAGPAAAEEETETEVQMSDTPIEPEPVEPEPETPDDDEEPSS